jgi:hypothetical protein
MNILVPLTILLLSWSIDSSDPEVQNRIFYIFCAVHIAIVFMGIYVFARVWQTNDKTLIRVKDAYTGDESIQKHWEYDVGKLRDLLVTKIGMSAAISAFLAARYGIPFPLLLQSLNNPKAVYQSELFRIYVKGEKAEGELQRPWAESGVLPDWAKSLWTQGEKDSEKFLSTGGGATALAAPSRASRKRK